MAQKVNVNFHQTFKPEVTYISSILEIANGDCFGSLQDISSYTGIPQGESSGKVEPHLNYAQFMGLITFEKDANGYHISRTELGDLVYEEDPGLQEKLTLLLCHSLMARNVNGAAMWNALFTYVLPRYQWHVSKETLIKELDAIFDSKISTKNSTPLWNSYDEMFASIELVEVSKDEVSANSIAIDKEYIYLFAYVLQVLWDELFEESDEISATQLEDLHFGSIFAWTTSVEYEVLERLAEKGLIRLNRQLSPYTIHRQVKQKELLKLLYSELF